MEFYIELITGYTDMPHKHEQSKQLAKEFLDFLCIHHLTTLFLVELAFHNYPNSIYHIHMFAIPTLVVIPII